MITTMTRALKGAVAVVLLLACGTARLEAVDFLRADVNSDGEVSISDSYALLARLFQGHGGLPDCDDALDTFADGTINISDGILILRHLFDAGVAPAQPFPEPGPAEPLLGCNEYGTGSPLDDPAASLVVLSAEAAGGEDGRATVVLGASHSSGIAGHSFRLRLPGDVFAGSEPGGVDITDTIGELAFDGGGMDGETFTHGFLASIAEPASIPPSAAVVPIYELVVCLKEGTPAGEYPLELSAGELIDAASGRAIKPQLVSGTLSVAADVSVSGDCSVRPNPDPSPRPPTPPGPGEPPPMGPTNTAQNVTWRIDDTAAAPGSSVVLPFISHADGSVQGYSASVDFNEELLTATAIEIGWEIPGGFEYGFSYFRINNENATSGSGGVDEGFLIAAAVFSLVSSVSLPADEDVVALRFHFDVNPEAPDGATEIRFLDGGQGDGQPVKNLVTSQGETIGIEFLESFVFVDCTLVIQAIVDIATFFVRGDANGDGRVALSDAQYTLNHLFTSSPQPPCFDAADANDDGRLDISDPIATLQFLFLDTGSAALPMPYPDPGEDPTPDGMTCAGRQS